MEGSSKAPETSSGNTSKKSQKILLPKCIICSEVFKDKNAFKNHMEGHKRPRNYTCMVCKKSFYTNSHLNRHLLYILTRNLDVSCVQRSFIKKEILPDIVVCTPVNDHFNAPFVIRSLLIVVI